MRTTYQLSSDFPYHLIPLWRPVTQSLGGGRRLQCTYAQPQAGAPWCRCHPSGTAAHGRGSTWEPSQARLSPQACLPGLLQWSIVGRVTINPQAWRVSAREAEPPPLISQHHIWCD